MKDKYQSEEDILASKGENDLLVDTVPRRYNLIKDYWETIETSLPKRSDKFARFIANYKNQYSEILDTPYPIDYPPWTEKNKDIIFSTAGVDYEEFTKVCSKIEGVNGFTDSFMKDKSQLILLLLMYRYYYQAKDEKMKTIITYYIGYAFYWQAFTTFFKVYKPTKASMEHTVNEMSFKFILRKTGSVNRLIYHGVSTICQTYIKRIERASDYELLYITEKIKDRFKIYMKSIFTAHDKTVKDKAVVLNSSEKYEDGKIRELDSSISSIVSVSEKYSARFLEDPISESALSYAIQPQKGSSVLMPKKDLRAVITTIIDDRNNMDDIKKLFESLFFIFIMEEGNEVKDIETMKFIITMMKMYKAGNSQDKNRIFIKDVLDKWLNLGSKTFRTTNRLPTLTNYRKAIYNYFIYRIAINK